MSAGNMTCPVAVAVRVVAVLAEVDLVAAVVALAAAALVAIGNQ